MTEKVKMGIVGLGCRGFSLLDTILACENAEIAAVCDVYPDRVNQAFEKVCKKQEGRTLRSGISMKKKKVKNLCEKAFATCL